MIKRIFLIVLFAALFFGFNLSSVIADEVTGTLTPEVQTGMEGVLKAAPSASPAAGGYNSNQSVTLTATSSTAICYTTDGTTPACAGATTCATGTKYTTAISVTSTQTITSIACYGDGSSGPVSTDTYTLTCAVSSVSNGTVSAYPSCAITCNSGYSLSGSTCVVISGGGGGGGVYVPPTPEMPETATGKVTVTVTAGGKTTVTALDGGKAGVIIPANAVSDFTDVEITPVAKTSSAVSILVGAVYSGKDIIGGYIYDFTAVSGGESVSVFLESITIFFTYTEEQIEGFDESTLKIYFWNESISKWVGLASSQVNTAAKTVTATTDHFTYFALIGELITEEAPEEEVVITEPPVVGMTIEELKAEIARITALILQLQARLAELLGEVVIEGVPAGFKFESTLRYGQASNDVKYLQIVLNSDPGTRLAGSGIGSPGYETNYFGTLTKAAVIKFQEKYTEDILAPWGLTKGTGFVGSTTRAKLNEILGR